MFGHGVEDGAHQLVSFAVHLNTVPVQQAHNDHGGFGAVEGDNHFLLNLIN